MAGLTLGHGIYIRHGHLTERSLSHELHHVQQYKQAGSISEYLPEHFRHIPQSGHADAPHERDARAFETGA